MIENDEQAKNAIIENLENETKAVELLWANINLLVKY